MSLREIRDAVRTWTREDQRWGEAMLIGVRRSAPRPPGARYAAAADGSFAGTISAGCVEADLREHVLAMLNATGRPAARVVSYGISDAMAAGVGLSCGGELDILIRVHEPGEPLWSRLLDLLDDDAAGMAQAALVTRLSDPGLGQQFLVFPDGSVGGARDADPPSPDPNLAMDRLFAREGSEILESTTGEAVFVDRVLPRRRLVVVGATPVAAALASLATTAGYTVTIVDPREALAQSPTFEGSEVVAEWPETALAGLSVDEWTDIAIVAHDERLDVPALHAALTAGCRYVGLLGGRKTQQSRRQALRERGVPSFDVERIYGPIGLDIGAVTPEEIAVSILAEMLARRRLGGKGP
jgi:xanthine dehydrogenase accessory factor